MNKTHGSRKQDIELLVKIAILKGEIKKAVTICEKYEITPKRFAQLAKEVESY